MIKYNDMRTITFVHNTKKNIHDIHITIHIYTFKFLFYIWLYICSKNLSEPCIYLQFNINYTWYKHNISLYAYWSFSFFYLVIKLMQYFNKNNNNECFSLYLSDCLTLNSSRMLFLNKTFFPSSSPRKLKCQVSLVLRFLSVMCLCPWSLVLVRP